MSVKTKIVIAIIVIIILSYLLSIYIGMDNSENNSKRDDKVWNISIYMSGDNDLSEYASKNMGLLKSVGSTEKVNIIALTDEQGEGNSKLCQVKLRSVNETPLNQMDSSYGNELNMGDNATLENFVIWSMKNYPADRYVLVIWGHGKGWRGIAPDGGDYLTMEELDSALNNIIEYNNGKKLDIIGFDACGMGMLEVFYQVKDYAKIAVASERIYQSMAGRIMIS